MISTATMVFRCYVFLCLCFMKYVTLGQSTNGEGCVAAGVTSCCQLGSCQVSSSRGSCFCDESCYSTRDCCNDIEFICPPPASPGAGSDEIESGSGSGVGSGVAPSDSSQTERPPQLNISQSNNQTITATNTSRLFINVTYDSGYPRGLLVWRHDGVIVSSRTDARVSVLSNGGLTIRNVRPSDAGLYTVTVTNQLGTASANFTVIFEPLVRVKFESPSYTFTESSGVVSICVVAAFAHSDSHPVTLSISPSSNTSAQAGADFVLNASSMKLSPDVPRACAGVLIVDDATTESTEQFNLNLHSSDRSVLIERQSTLVKIIDNDSAHIVLEKGVYEISESVGKSLSHLALLVCAVQNTSLQTAISDTVNITLTTEDGTAAGDADFVPKQVDLLFDLSDNRTRVCACVQLLDDQLVEGDEDFSIVVSSPDQRIVGSRSAVRIIDDDEIVINLEKTEYVVSEDMLHVEVCIVATGDEANHLTVYICTEGNTARDEEDYIGLTAYLLHFSPALSTTTRTRRECVTIPIVDDSVVERKERFLVSLQSDPRMPRNMIIGKNSTASVTIKDDDTPDAIFNNDTPYVQGNLVMISFNVRQRHSTFSHILCTLQGPGASNPIIRNCSFGTFAYNNLPLRYQEYEFKIEGVQEDGSKVLLNKRGMRLDTDVCSLHLVNEGVTVSGDNSTVEWQATGPYPYHKATHFTCWIDRLRTGIPCVSPLALSGLSPGNHRLTVQPVDTAGCRRMIPRRILFTVDP